MSSPRDFRPEQQSKLLLEPPIGVPDEQHAQQVAADQRFQAALGDFFNTRKGDLLDKIRNEKPDLKKDATMVDAVKSGIEDFKKSWK